MRFAKGSAPGTPFVARRRRAAGCLCRCRSACGYSAATGPGSDRRGAGGSPRGGEGSGEQMTIMKGTWLLLAAVCLGASATAEAGATLDAVKRKGYVQCGVSDGLPGFSYADAKGRFKGLDVDICRALAAALFGDAEKVRFTPLSATERFSALQSGTVDLLSRNTSWTSSRDTALGIHFTGVTYFDGQGFLVNRKLGVSSARELKDATVCIQSGTTNEPERGGLLPGPRHPLQGGARRQLREERPCPGGGAVRRAQAPTSRRLYAQRLKLAKPEQYVVLPEVISKEPLGPAVRQGDEAWFNIVRWTLYGLLNAEEPGGHLEQRRAPGQGQPQPGRRPPARQRGRRWQGLATAARLGGADGAPGRQLWRDLRPQRRRRQPAEDAARPQRAMESRRPALCAADSLTGGAG